MSSFDGQPAPLNTLQISRRLADQEIISFDDSPFSEGTHCLITSGPLFVLAGNQPVMKFWKHNFDFTNDGSFGGRNMGEACGLILYCEDNTLRYYGAPSAQRGSPPAFTQVYTIDLLATYGTNVRAGCVGELITATIATPGTSLTTATPANVITTPFLSLTAGDWDVWGEVCFLPAATTSITQIAAGINSVSATLPAAGSGLTQETHAALVPTAIPQCFDVVERRVSIAATTPYYLVAQAAFTVSTLTAFGSLYARRRR